MTTRILTTFKSDPTAFLAFYKYAIDHMVLDSLNFLLDVNEYKALQPFLRGNKEEQIVNKYIKQTSKECINVTHRIRDAILEKWGSARLSIFDKAAESCNTLLEDEALADFKASYKPEQQPVVSLKGKALLNHLSGLVHPDMVGPIVFLLTGQRPKKEDLKRQALNQESALKKWFFEGDHIFQVLWLAMEEDLDPVALASIFSLFSPYPPKLQDFLLHVIGAGLEEAKSGGTHLLSELDSAECVLKEYLFSIGKSWWTKVLKKVTESIYKEEIHAETDSEGGTTAAGREKLFGLISSVVQNITAEPKVPTELRFVLKTVFNETSKRFPALKKDKVVLASTKILIDACCTLLCTPDKAPFDVSIKDAMITRSTALLVCEGLKSLFEVNSDGLGRSAEMGALINDVKTKFGTGFNNWVASQLNEPADIKPAQSANKVENDINIIGHYLASNTAVLFKAFNGKELGVLASFLESNAKDGSSFSSLGEASDMSDRRFKARMVEADDERSFPERSISSKPTISSQKSPKTPSKPATSSSSFTPNTPIGELVKFIVKDKLQIPVDPTKFTTALKEECIFKVGHLQMLPSSELGRIHLPVLVRYALSEYCVGGTTALTPTAGFGGMPGEAYSTATAARPTLKMFNLEDAGSDHSESEDIGFNSNFGLSTDERTLVRKSWMMLHKKVSEAVKIETEGGSETVGSVFYGTLWEEWIKLDPIAQSMFKSRSRKEREIHVNRILGQVMGSLDDPAAGKEKIKMLSIQHCIWNIQSESFGALSLSFAKALQASLKTDLDEDTKNAWVTLLTTFGSLITDRYEGVIKGQTGEIWVKTGAWKKHFTKMTHDTLLLFKNKTGDKKPKSKLLFQHATDVDTIDDESKLDAPTPYVFSITFGAVTKYFCATNSETFKEWVDGISYRIKAYTRLRSKTDEQTKMTTAEMKRLKIKDKSSNESKAEKAAHKVLRYRKHIDAQIKTAANFALFDNLTQCTIVIDVKGIIQYVNEAVSTLFGYSGKELLGKNVKMLMPRQYAIDHDSYLENYVNTGKKKIIGIGRDLPILMKDGTERTCNLTVVEHQQTGTRLFIGTLVPPSDFSSTSESGERQTDNFSLFDKMLQPTISINKEGIVTYVNDAVSKFSGYAKNEMIGRNVSMLMPQRHASAHDTYLQNYLKTGVKKVIGLGRRVHMKLKDGTEKPCFLTVTEHFNGAVPFFVGTLGECTPNDDVSSESRASKDDTDAYALFDNLLDATIAINNEGIVQYVNNAVTDMTGYKRFELIGKNVNMIMPPAIARKHDGFLRAYARTGVKHIIGKGRGVVMMTKSGAHESINLSVIEHEIGGQVQFIGTITPQKDEYSLYDSLLDTTIVINEQGIIQYANEAVKKLSGYRPSALIGKNVKMLMPQEYAVKHDRYLKTYIQTGKKKIIGTGRALPLLTRSGTVVSGHLSVVESRVGGRRVFVGTLVTKQVQEELQEMRLLNMTRNVLQDIANPCVVITKRGNIKVFNSAAEATFGYKLEEVSGKNIKLMMPESYAVGHDAYLKNYLKTGESKIVGYGRVVPVLLADKTVGHYHLSVSVKKKDDKVIYFIGIFNKIVSVDVLGAGVVHEENVL